MAVDLTVPPTFGVAETEDLGLDRDGQPGHPPFGGPSYTTGLIAPPIASRVTDSGRIQGGKGLLDRLHRDNKEGQTI